MIDEAIRAHRCWEFDPAKRTLRSPQTGTAWIPGVRATARCITKTPTHGDGRVPVGDCTCGFHGWRSAKHLPKYVSLSYERVTVFGTVSLWGQFVECERGYRAEHAYPYEFLLLPSHAEHADVLREMFGVDVRVLGLVK